MVKPKDLTDIGDSDHDQRQSEYVVCLDCGRRFGGTRGDYWDLDMNEPFQCPDCESTNLALAVDTVHQTILRQ